MSKIDEKAAELAMRQELGELEMQVLTSYTLPQAIRDGATVTEHCSAGWGDGDTACALTNGVIAARSRKYL